MPAGYVRAIYKKLWW